MTGEITTLGEVCAIGGVREKLTACKNHNITRVVLPLANKKNVKKLPDEFKRGFTIYYVTNIKQLYEVCFPSEDHAVEENQSSFHEKLASLNIEIDEFEADNFHKVVFEGEIIEQSNKIEQLF
jgi:predicted ATP-dependent protease